MVRTASISHMDDATRPRSILYHATWHFLHLRHLDTIDTTQPYLHSQHGLIGLVDRPTLTCNLHENNYITMFSKKNHLLHHTWQEVIDYWEREI